MRETDTTDGSITCGGIVGFRAGLRAGPRAWRKAPDAADALPTESAGLEALSRANAAIWPELGNVGWEDIAQAVGAPSVRVAQYRLNLHGWKFGGRGTRVVLQAPCDGCSIPHDPADLVDHCCPACLAMCGG